MKRNSLAFLLCFAAAPVLAQVSIVPGTLNAFRDTRSTNDVRIPHGDEVQFGASIAGGSVGDYVRAFDSSTGAVTSWTVCGPLAVNADFCARSLPYTSSLLRDPWQIQFTKDTALGPQGSFAAPSVAAATNPIGFPTNVTISSGATATTPVISWTDPAGYTPNSIRVSIYDKNDSLANGKANIIESATLVGTATSFSLPAIVNSSGQSLQIGGNYAIDLQLITTRDGSDGSSNNATFLERSQSFFDFSPQSGAVPNIALPTITSSGVYSFHVGSVSSSSETFIDPTVATGFTYATAAGEPNFKSVLLPNVGGGHFTISYTVNGVPFVTSLAAGAQFFFPGDGVATFEVTGINPGVDPTNGQAFVTGLTFEANGSFDGTMTPITVTAAVPEPSTWALFVLGLGVVARGRGILSRRGKRLPN